MDINNLYFQWTKIDINKTVTGGYSTDVSWTIPVALTQNPLCVVSTIFEGAVLFIVTPYTISTTEIEFRAYAAYYTSSYTAKSMFAMLIGI